MIKSRRFVVRRTVASLCLVLLFALTCEAKEVRYLTGSAEDVRPKLHGPAHDFGGGGGDVFAAMQWMIDRVRGCDACETKLDVVVLRSSGADGYNAPVYALRGVDSVETLVIKSREDANSRAASDTVRNAEIIFFAGGDQCNYVTYFKGTEVEKGVERVYARGGGVGGSSAGLAIQGSAVYDACSGGSATSKQALSNPYHADVSFTYHFFDWRNMRATITDTHFVRRDRMGRTLAFLARQVRDGKYKRALALAVDEKTSVVVDKEGLARVIGQSVAYVVLADHRPEVCEPGVPLTYSDYKIWRLKPDDTFDLKRPPKTGYYTVSVSNGRITSN
ncbi:MAG TPA: hypothetical protein VF507_06860, partial [Pyrinomonadaceae bacterium]